MIKRTAKIKVMPSRSNLYTKIPMCGMMIVFMLLVSGCWDRAEINDLGLINATAYDAAPDGGIQYSIQVLIPSGGGGDSGGGSSGAQKKKSFVVETATGMDPGDAEKNIQKKFPRRLFRGHRRVIIIGEDLARKGLDMMLDSIGRDPQNRLRTNVLVAKGKKGIDILKMDYPLERIPSEAMREMVTIGIEVNANIRDLLIAASGVGTQPIAVAIGPGEDEKSFKPLGIALFKDLKLAGYINTEETDGYLLAVGKYRKGVIAAKVPKNDGVIRVNIKNAKTKITPEIKGKKPRISIKIKGEGSVYGNSTKLDLSVPKYLELAQRQIQEKIKEQVESTIKKVQQEYNTDIFCFGSYFMQYKPKEWKKLESKWSDIFPVLKVSVSVDFKLKTSGMSGPPLYLKEKEVKKK